MILLSDCFSKKTDEGCIKVANSLAKRLKDADRDTLLVGYKNKTGLEDCYFRLNRFFLNPSLYHFLREKKQDVLYLPFSSNTRACVLRTFFLSRFCGQKVSVLFALRYPMDRCTRLLLKKSTADILTLSGESYQFFRNIAGSRVQYLKTGVDTQRFCPADPAKKQLLREKYRIPASMPVLFHAGHLKAGRNIDRLAELDPQYFVLLAVSSVTEQEASVRSRLLNRPNTRIIDTYVEQIEELYQLSDAYLFPVEQQRNCIDIPVSVLEAAACSLPVITTRYGELNEFRSACGFFFLDSVTPESIQSAVRQALSQPGNSRKAVLPYDWSNAVASLLHK